MKGLKFAKRMLHKKVAGGRRFCTVCESRVWTFFPYRGSKPSDLMKALDVVGSDIVNFECPRCHSHDRERHLYLYLRAANLLEPMRGQSVLHFAPERHLANLIAAMQPARHIKCDLFPKSSEIEKADITNLQFQSDSFDVLIANHILEHVDDDARALSEIYRVLKPGGIAILQTPFSRKLLHTWSDGGINDAAARNQAFGQEDHVRLYGQDIFDRISASGLVSEVRSHSDLLAGEDAWKAGVNTAEPFFLFRKPA